MTAVRVWWENLVGVLGILRLRKTTQTKQYKTDAVTGEGTRHGFNLIDAAGCLARRADAVGRVRASCRLEVVVRARGVTSLVRIECGGAKKENRFLVAFFLPGRRGCW